LPHSTLLRVKIDQKMAELPLKVGFTVTWKLQWIAEWTCCMSIYPRQVEAQHARHFAISYVEIHRKMIELLSCAARKYKWNPLLTVMLFWVIKVRCPKGREVGHEFVDLSTCWAAYKVGREVDDLHTCLAAQLAILPAVPLTSPRILSPRSACLTWFRVNNFPAGQRFKKSVPAVVNLVLAGSLSRVGRVS
jgi:hypothetical protein